jgi:membrane associated rhomboid family serine protease
MIPLRDDVPRRRFPIINWLLIATNVAVFILQWTRGEAMDRFAAIPASISSGRHLYTILTSMFMHGGILHILSNMWFLYIFGDNVEDAFGHIGYLAIYLVSGICGALLQVVVSQHSTIPMIGASGAISGVLGAYLVLYPRARILTLIPIFIFIQFINVPAFVFLGFWIIIQLLSGLAAPRAGGGVAFFAHIGGFAFGLLMGILVRIFKPRNRLRYRVY